MPRLLLLLVALVALASARVAHAGPIYAQDFDALAPGPLAGQDGWLTNFGTADVQSSVSVSGQAVEIAGEVRRTGIFAPAALAPIQQLSFSFRMSDTIVDFAGGLHNLQHTVFLLGPSTNQATAFVYKGLTDANGVVVRDRFEVRGSTEETSPTPLKDVWYSVEARFDFIAADVDFIVRDGSGVFWDPAPIGFDVNGNQNLARFTSGEPSAGIFLDNILNVPEPSTAALLLPGVMVLLAIRGTRRRRGTKRQASGSSRSPTLA